MSEFIDNHTRRKEKIKEALKQIHAGKPYQEVKTIFAEILDQASAQEIVEIEEALIADGLPVEISSICVMCMWLCSGNRWITSSFRR